jgi:flagellar hook-associated protein 1 FlgK
MSLNGILNNGISGLMANQTALRITSDNVANVNTQGYVRKVVDFQNRIAGSSSAGVEIAGIQRIVDAFLQKASYAANADAGRYTAMDDIQGRLQALLGSPSDNTSFSGKIDAVFSSISDAELDPSTAVRRQAVLSAIADFGAEADRVSKQVQDLRLDASNKITQDVSTINASLEQIFKLNPLIVRQKQIGGDSSALEEARSNAINQLSNLVDVQVQTLQNGSVNISTTSGISLLDGALYQVSYDAPGTVASETQFSPIMVTRLDPTTGQPTSATRELDSNLKSGELKGLLDMRDHVLPDLADQIGELSSQFVDALNAAHNQNTAFPPPNTLTGKDTGLLSTDLQGFTGQAEFAVVDKTGQLVASTTVDFDALAPGSTIQDVVTAVNTGLGGAGTMTFNNGVLSFQAASATNGVAIGQVSGDESSRGGHGFSQFFGLNDLVQSNVPSNFDTGFTTTDAHGFTPGGTMALQLVGPNGAVATNYTLTVGGSTFGDILNDLNTNMGSYVNFSLDSNGALVTTPASGFENYKIRVISDSTARGSTNTSMSQLFGIGDNYVADAATGIAVNPAIMTDQSKLALGQLDTSVAAGQPVLTAGDNRGAIGLSNVATKTIDFADYGTLKSINSTLGQYAATVLANTGIQASQVSQLSQDANALKSAVDQKQADTSGVNLDEELSNMIVYQNAYAAAGRVIKVAQDVYDTLLQII